MPPDQNDTKRNLNLKDELYNLNTNKRFVVWRNLCKAGNAEICSDECDCEI